MISNFQTSDPKTRDDLRRINAALDVLRRETERLQQEIDAGGGGGGGAVADVTSGSAAIGVAPTTGNVVVSLDESQLENGGAQEIDVTGLSGPLADPQKIEVAKAASLVGTRKRINLIEGTGVTLTVADDAPNDRVNITFNASSTVRRCNYWDLPTTPHANDEEFDGTVLPSAFSAWRTTGTGGMTPYVAGVDLDTVPPSPNISPTVPLAVGKVAKIQVNNPVKPSEVVVQMNTTTNLFYGRRMQLQTDHVFRARMHRFTQVGGSIGQEAYLMICRDVAGIPENGHYVRIGWGIGAGQTINARYSHAGSGPTGNMGDTTGIPSVTPYRNCEFGFRKRGVGDWCPFVVSNQETIEFVETGFASGSFIHTGQFVWVGFYFVTAGIAGVGRNIMSADYLRQQDNLNIW